MKWKKEDKYRQLLFNTGVFKCDFCCFQAKAAEERSKDFKQGGGGEKLKAKAKRLEDAENKNKIAFGGPGALKASDLQ